MLITHQLQYLENVDQIILLENVSNQKVHYKIKYYYFVKFKEKY